MFKINKPIIEKNKDSKMKPYTQISFIPDFKRFGIEKLTDDHLCLFKKRVYDLAACTNKNVKVYLNNELIEIQTFEDYIRMFYDEKEQIPNVMYEEVNDRWKVGIVYDNQNGFNQISYVNGICTYQGGTHIQYILDQITTKLINYISTKHKQITVKPSMIRENLTVFIDSIIEDPSFSSQTKETLTTKISLFGSTCEVPDTLINKLINSGIVENVVNLAKYKADEELKKTDGKKVQTLRGLAKLDDALWAGTRRSKECYLILTEGDSAKKFAIDGLEVIGREKYGVFPLRGKLLNVREATSKQILNNEEFSNIKQIMGLKQNKKYNDTSQLRYGGGVVILTDADVDGSHIKGLIINMFHKYWPSLLKKKGFIQALSTPIIKVYKKTDAKKKEPVIFYTLSEYDKWRKEEESNNTINKWEKPKYYKGLGTSTTAEAKQLFNEFEKRILKFNWETPMGNNNQEEDNNQEDNNQEEDDKKKKKSSSRKSTPKNSEDDNGTDKESDSGKDEEEDDDINDMNSKSYNAITLAFEKARANDRKSWLRNYKKDVQLEPNEGGYIGFSDFVHKELIHFSTYDNVRSIPSVCDGQKPSQRKILHTFFKNNIYKNEIKVAGAASDTQKETEYHHGEMSLQGTIINMAQDYVGSNNINLLLPNGNFGSRREGGQDAASARYIFTQLNSLNKKIFRQEDMNILNYLVEEGKQIEPEYFLPIIPLVLVNGAEGIGTGFSTFIPSFNPKDIINNLLLMLDGELPKNMVPWYWGFKGTIEKYVEKNAKKKDEVKYVSNGVYEIIDENTVRITELPICVWTTKYKEYLEKFLVDPKSKANSKTQFIEKIINNSGNYTVDFTIVFAGNHLHQMLKNDSLVKNLKLTNTINLSNMYLHDNRGVITKYEYVTDIIHEFYDIRLEGYKKRKEYRIKQLMNEMELLKYKVKFINQIINEEIDIRNRDESDLNKELQEKGYPELSNDCNAEDNDKDYSYLHGMAIRTLTKQKRIELEKVYNDKLQELEDYKSITVEELWKRELLELQTEYEKWLTERNESTTEGVKDKKRKNNRKTDITKITKRKNKKD